MPLKLPMGKLDKFDVGSRKLTVQTEFIQAALCKIETKVYLGGELKKVLALEVHVPENEELQQVLDEYHRARVQEIVDGLRRKNPG